MSADASDSSTPTFDASFPDAAIEWCEAGPPVLLEAGTCDTFLAVPCGLPDGAEPYACNVLTTYLCEGICGSYGAQYGCFLPGVTCDEAGVPIDAGGAGPLVVECVKCNGGRRPRGFRAPRNVYAASAVGDFVARTSHLEAASILAFNGLHDELRTLGAPRALCTAARRAARDETRHGRVTAEIARAHGGRVPRPRAMTPRRRSIEALAIENAVEGCVGETFGALVAAYQGQHAQDAAIARAMKRIAVDETRHAALAWSVATWAAKRLDAPAKRRVARARKRAIARLRRAVDAHVPSELVRVAGLPPRAMAVAFVDALERELWG